MNHKFRLNQAVWIDCGEDGRTAGKVTSLDYNEAAGLHYGVEVDNTGIVLGFPEGDLTARYVSERIGGLAQIRQKMAEEQLESEQPAQEDYDGCLGVPDHELTADQLSQKYNSGLGWGDHPQFSSNDWRYEVTCGNTRMGYWDWVSYRLNE